MTICRIVHASGFMRQGPLCSCGGFIGYDWKENRIGETIWTSKDYCKDCGLQQPPWLMRGNNVTHTFIAIIIGGFLALYIFG